MSTEKSVLNGLKQVTALSSCNSIINQIPSYITSEINREVTYGVMNAVSWLEEAGLQRCHIVKSCAELRTKFNVALHTSHAALKILISKLPLM
jgi:hypothetical protein